MTRPVVDVPLAELAGPDAPLALVALRARHPVAWVPALEGWLVTSHALALQVLRDAAGFTVDDPRFTTARVVGASMLSTDGDEHRRHRQPFTQPFRRRELEDSYADVVGGLARGLVDRVRPRGEADLRTELAGPLSVAVVARALGLRDVEPATVLGWYADIVAAVTDLSAGERPSGAERAAMRELDAAVRAALAGGTTPLLGAARGVLSDEEVVANAAVMMFGGIETTEGMISTLLVHLLREPTVLARVRDDRALVSLAVEESLRLEPAAAVVDRYATGDVVLGDAEVAAGELVRVSLSAANRDPAVFARPDAFDLDRVDVRAQLAFARGPHACIAMDPGHGSQPGACCATPRPHDGCVAVSRRGGATPSLRRLALARSGRRSRRRRAESHALPASRRSPRWTPCSTVCPACEWPTTRATSHPRVCFPRVWSSGSRPPCR